MKISVKSSQGGGLFGGNPSSEVTIEASDYDAGQATVSAMMLLAQNGIGEYPKADDDETTITGDAIPPEAFGDETDAPYDPVPAAGWSDKDATANWQAGDQSPSPAERISKPGDSVRLVWPDDNSSRLFIDSGTQWVSPAVAGVFSEPMSVEYTDPHVTAHLVARQPERGERIDPFENNQE